MAPEFIVSYGYRHILAPEVFSLAGRAAVNLHISLLPWNRGADPNLWSFVEGTPKGVTIHHIDAGIDTGDIIAQRRVEFTIEATLAQTYDRLDREVVELFTQTWSAIESGDAPRRAQPPGGSFHRVADRATVEHLLTLGWDTPIAAFMPGPASPSVRLG
jgi:methionyl-tRNA formyltransferase